MLKRRVAAIEKRIAGLGGAAAKMPQLVFCFGDGTDLAREKAEAHEGEKGNCVFRFDFGDGGQADDPNEKTKAVADSSYPIEREKVRK